MQNRIQLNKAICFKINAVAMRVSQHIYIMPSSKKGEKGEYSGIFYYSNELQYLSSEKYRKQLIVVILIK